MSVEAAIEDGVEESMVLGLVERIRTLRNNTAYGLLHPKFKRLRELYKPLETRVTLKGAEALRDEIERLEGSRGRA